MPPGLPPGPGAAEARAAISGLLRALHIDDPIPCQKFLRFREHTVRNRLPVLPRAHHLGLARPPQALGRDKHSRVLEFLAERAHESDVLLQVFLRPLRVFIPICPRARHHQNKSHILFSPLIPFRASHSATTGASAVPHRSIKTLALDNSRTHALRSARSSAFHRVPALLKFAPL